MTFHSFISLFVNRCALSVIKLKYKILYRREALITIQKTVRMHLARVQHQPRYQGVASLKKLRNQIAEVGRMAGSLKSDKDSVLANAKKIGGNVDAAIRMIKSKPDIKKPEIDQMYKSLVVQINDALGDVKKKIEKQKILEEQVWLICFIFIRFRLIFFKIWAIPGLFLSLFHHKADYNQ